MEFINVVQEAEIGDVLYVITLPIDEYVVTGRPVIDIIIIEEEDPILLLEDDVEVKEYHWNYSAFLSEDKANAACARMNVTTYLEGRDY